MSQLGYQGSSCLSRREHRDHHEDLVASSALSREVEGVGFGGDDQRWMNGCSARSRHRLTTLTVAPHAAGRRGRSRSPSAQHPHAVCRDPKRQSNCRVRLGRITEERFVSSCRVTISLLITYEEQALIRLDDNCCAGHSRSDAEGLRGKIVHAHTHVVSICRPF